jgi:hypothetical protein
MPLTIRQIEEAFTARVEALNASAYALAPGHTPAWREASIALTPAAESAPRSHLSFNVWVDSVANIEQARGSSWLAAEPDTPVDETVYVEASLRIAFLFELRASQQVADSRKASDAAHDVLRAVLPNITPLTS